MKKFVLRLIGIILSVYVLGCGYMYFMQESFIFKPEKLSQKNKLSFEIPHEEMSIYSNGAKLSCVLCAVPKSKGLIFFLHGNTGNLNDQEVPAKFYNSLGFDFFTFDYRGFGKSTGEITSEDQFLSDIDRVYQQMKKKYSEKKITVIGYSLGTCPAAYITSKNHPDKLVLIAPYYSMSEMAIKEYKIIPTFLLKYKFDTYKYVQKIKNEILLIHGTKDETLPYEGSVSLSKLLSEDDEFLTVKGQGHNNFEENKIFSNKVIKFLAY